MCVAVTMEPNTELTLEEVVKMGNANGDGFGMAWAENGVVHWWKTLNYDVDYLAHMINSHKDFFRLVHFRLTTVGGTRVELCHPFEIGPRASYHFHGSGQRVMIHNGHWGRSAEIFDLLHKEKALPDNGPWSDSRLAAFLASYDEEWLTTVTGRVATLDGEGNLTRLGFWDDLRSGIKVSNKIWDSHTYQFRRTGSKNWAGWGWSEEDWKEKEKWDKAQKEKAELAAKEAANEQTGQGSTEGATGGATGGSQKEGTVRVASQSKDQHLLPSQAGQGAEHRGPGAAQDGRGRVRSHEGQGPKREEGQSNAKGRKEAKALAERVYDSTPWQNSETGEWWWIPPDSIHGNSYKLERIDESQARAIMVALAASVHGEGEH